MRAIVLENYDHNIVTAIRNLKVIQKEIPKVSGDKVLIQMEASPCNPSDIAFIRGMYNIKKTLPVVAGFEGSGLVVDAGNHPEAQRLLGKRVSCFSQDNSDGTWAEYFLTSPVNCVVIRDELDIDQAGCLFINPFTAYALFNKIRERKCRSFIQNAAAGQIGAFINRFAEIDGVTSINIVRKEEHIDKLKSEGLKYVLNLKASDFKDQLKELAFKHKATIAFDAVGGELTGILINSMPRDSRIYVYGGLGSQQLGGIDVLPLIFDRKTIKGFNLTDWILNKTPEEFQMISEKLQHLILSGEIRTNIQRSLRLEDVGRGLILYISRMSNGKVLFKPQEK